MLFENSPSPSSKGNIQAMPTANIRSEIEKLWGLEGAKDVEHAFLGLSANLLQWASRAELLDLETRRVHSETLLAAIGALAGCASAQVAWARLKLNPARIAELRIYQKTPGSTRYFDGAILDGWIFPIKDGERFHLWDQFVTGAREAGFVTADSPLAIPMINAVVSAILEDQFGRLSVPHQPHLAIKEMVERLWYGYQNYLAAVSQECRPTLTAMVARNYIVQMKDVIDPRIALTIVTESAHFMAKIDPEALDLDRGKRLAKTMRSSNN
jgi:hypothetical protein